MSALVLCAFTGERDDLSPPLEEIGVSFAAEILSLDERGLTLQCRAHLRLPETMAFSFRHATHALVLHVDDPDGALTLSRTVRDPSSFEEGAGGNWLGTPDGDPRNTAESYFGFDATFHPAPAKLFLQLTLLGKISNRVAVESADAQ